MVHAVFGSAFGSDSSAMLFSSLILSLVLASARFCFSSAVRAFVDLLTFFAGFFAMAFVFGFVDFLAGDFLALEGAAALVVVAYERFEATIIRMG